MSMVTVATNLITNPSFESASGPLTVRTNLASNPSLGTDSSGWTTYVPSGSATSSRATDGGFSGPSYFHTVWTGATNGGGPYYTPTPAVAGKTYSASVHVRASKAMSLALNMEWYNSSGTQISRSYGPTVVTVAGQWIELDNLAASAPTGATRVQFTVYPTSGSTWAVNDTLDVDALMVEQSSVVGPFFDGNTPAAGDFSYAWTGTVNESASIQQGVGVATNTNSGSAYVIQSSAWAQSGGFSALVIPVTTDSFVSPGGDSGALRLGMQPGKTYTVLGTIRLSAPLTGALRPARALGITAFFLPSGASNYVETNSSPAPNVAGTYQVRLTFSVPAGATQAFIRLYNGATAGGGNVWWDDALLVEGSYGGAYFDGSTPTDGTSSYSWSGTPNASTSIQTVQPGQPASIEGQLVNLFQNPSFEAGDADAPNVVVRTNYSSDPAATRGDTSNLPGVVDWQATRWFGSSPAAGTYTTISNALDGPLPELSTYLRKQWTTASTSGGDTGFGLGVGGTNGFVVTPGDTWTVSTYLRASMDRGTSSMTIYWYDSTGTAAGSVVGVNTPLTANLWSRRSVTGSVPAGVAFMSVVSDVDGAEPWAVGATLDGTGLLVEKTSDLRDYIDSNTPSTLVRTNYITYPDASAWATNATDSGFDNNRYTRDESYTLLTGLTVPPTALTTAARITWKTTAASGRGFDLAGNPDGNPASVIPVQAGVPVTVSLYVRPSTATMAQQIRYLFSDHLNQPLGSELFATTVTPAAGVWTRVWVTVTPPVGASYISLALTLDGGSAVVAVGDTLDATGLLVETGGIQGYFDGNTPPIDQTSYEWTSQPGHGMSQARTPTDFSYMQSGTVPVTQMQAHPVAQVGQGTACAAFQSGSWRSSGSWSLRLMPTVTGNSNSSSGNIAGDWVQSAVMLPGHTYTVLASFYQPSPQTGVLSATARSIIVSYTSSGQTVVTTAQAQNISGVQQLRLTVTLPITTSSATISLTNGASYGNGDVWWDDMLVIDGAYDGDFFDGDTPSTADWEYTWSVGSPNYGLSTSIATAPSNTGLELTVYSGTSPTTAIDILARATGISTLEEIPTGNGAGSFSLLSTDAVFADNPTICDYRNVVKLSCNDRVVSAFLIQNLSATQLDTNDGQDILNTYTGEGLRTWFNDAVVYPETGLIATAYDNRYFNFSSHDGAWRDTAQWTTPVVNANYVSAGPGTYASPYNGSPTNWPTQASGAKWIWNAAFSRTNTPAGDVYFRREFDTTGSNVSVDLYITADDYYEAYIDSQLVSSTTDTPDNWQNTYKVTVTLPAGHHVLGIKGSNSVVTVGPASILAAMFYSPNDSAGTLGALILETGDTGWVCCGYPFFPPGWTVGAVLLQLLAEAQARGVLFASFLQPTFTAGVDTNQKLWQSEYELNLSVGASYADVIAQIEALGYEIWIDPDTFALNAAPLRGTTRSDTISIESGLNLISSDGSAQADITNALAMKSNDGWSETTSTSSITQYGRIEGSSSITGSMVQGSDLAATLIRTKSDPEIGASYSFTPSPGCIPYVDFFVGDYVLAPDILTGQMVPRRVVSITTTQDNAGNPVYVLEFDVVFQAIEQRLSSQLSQISNGTINTAGSTSGTNPFGSGSGKAILAPGNGRIEQYGTFSFTNGYTSVTFPSGLFTTAPIVLFSPVSGVGSVWAPWPGAAPTVNGFSATGFTLVNPAVTTGVMAYYAFQQ